MLAIVLAANNVVLAIEVVTPPNYSCIGFEPPMDREEPVEVQKNRVMPLKAVLEDQYGYLVTEDDFIPMAPPVIQVIFEPGVEDANVTGAALFAGHGTDGNQFVFTGSNLQFNLKTKNYTASGTYHIKMLSGDESQYTINPTCEAYFVVIQ